MLFADLAAGPASAQGLLNRSAGPVAIDADEGIEWRRDEKVYIATGNAKAVRGDITVTAHRLIAYYRERDPARGAPVAKDSAAKDSKEADGGASSTDIYRLVAETDVTISTPTQKATGDHGVYDVDRGVLVLTGDHLALDTSQDHITRATAWNIGTSARSRWRAATASWCAPTGVSRATC
ncbi:MAG: LptA/OstA family protein [Pseudomonadota bacterium]